MNIKKIILVILILLLLGLGVFWFFNKDSINNVITNNFDFGTFFDTNPQSQNNNPPINTIIEEPSTEPGIYTPPILRQISFEPVSGYTSYKTTTNSLISKVNEENLEVVENQEVITTTIRFQERATGHIYEVFELQPNPKQISNITISKIYETIFTKNKDEYIYRFPNSSNEQIISKKSTLYFTEKPDDVAEENFTPEATINTLDLSSSIREIVYIAEKNKIVYPITQDNSSFIFIANPDRTEEVVLKNIPFNEFMLSNINQDKVLVTTKANRDTKGYAYILDINTKEFTKVLGDILGLTAKVSPDTEWVLYSESNQTQPLVYVYNTKIGNFNSPNFNTLPTEKCVFPTTQPAKAYCFGSLFYKSAMYPDDWYKGKVFNSENVYEIDLLNGQISPLFTFTEQTFDGFNVTLSEGDTHLIFQNKYDLTLWSLDLQRLIL